MCAWEGMHVFLGVCVFEPVCAWSVHPCGIALGYLSLPFNVCSSFLRRLPELSSCFPIPPADALTLLSSSPFPHLWLFLPLGHSEMSHCPSDPRLSHLLSCPHLSVSERPCQGSNIKTQLSRYYPHFTDNETKVWRDDPRSDARK